MKNTIQRELLIDQPRERVWQALTDPSALAEWMFPNDFAPEVGRHFTFRVPPNPQLNFAGLTVQCEVLECDPPRGNEGGKLVFSWSAGGPVVNTLVSFQLEPSGDGTRLLFEHSGFDLTHEWGEQALKGAEFGWAKMLGRLPEITAGMNAALRTGRLFSASPRNVFAAFERPELLAEWWGPNGFTNTFEQFEFKPGGRWIFVMHAPNGADYANESIFGEIEPDRRIVIEHIVNPWFTLTVTLTPRGDETHLDWVQRFENAEVADKMRSFGETANEQVLDRLQALLAREKS